MSCQYPQSKYVPYIVQSPCKRCRIAQVCVGTTSGSNNKKPQLVKKPAASFPIASAELSGSDTEPESDEDEDEEVCRQFSHSE